jgi:hypothetical protein
LNYNGSSYAVSLQGESSGIEGCDFNIGATATEGIHQVAPYTTVRNVSLNGGGTSTILHHISGANVTFDSDEKMWNLTGIGVQVDNSIDVFLKTFDVYGAINNGLTEQTSISLLVESGVGGLNVTDWSGGGSGLHGLVVRNTINPSAGGPSWLNFHNFVSDCSGGGDGWLFDSSLGSAQIGATFVDSWSAGAGQDCNQVTMTNANAAGVHISGGSGIHIVGGGKIRANASHGVLIDGAGLQGIEIADNQITANGFATDFQASRAYKLLNSYVRPLTNNPGNYLFKLTAVGTSGSANPTWCQTVNCTVTSGSTTWQNIGTANDAVAGKDIVDPAKFQDGLGKVIDGVVQCLNSSAWSKSKAS